MYEWLFEPPGYTPAEWDPVRARTTLIGAIAGERSTILVAESEQGELVGIVSAYLDLESVRFGLRCWVEDLAVDPARRSAGIGKALLDAAKAWASERGATHLELDTGLARIAAQRFYDREAPRAKGYSYSWALTPPRRSRAAGSTRRRIRGTGR
jgi:GNAT superfamily N-acetyltransferase